MTRLSRTIPTPLLLAYPSLNSSHLKMDGWNITYLLDFYLFRCYVGFGRVLDGGLRKIFFDFCPENERKTIRFDFSGILGNGVAQPPPNISCIYDLHIITICAYLIGFDTVYMDVSENSGTPKSSILVGFSTINHPFSGTAMFGNIHIYIDTCPTCTLYIHYYIYGIRA